MLAAVPTMPSRNKTFFIALLKEWKNYLRDLMPYATQRGINVEILGMVPDARIPGLEGPRANCTERG